MPAAEARDRQGSEGHQQRLRRRTRSPVVPLPGDMWGHTALVPPDSVQTRFGGAGVLRQPVRHSNEPYTIDPLWCVSMEPL